MKDNGVHFLTIQSRIKEEDSIRSKAFEKNYTDPDQLMMDIIGLRVIVYLESDVDKVSKIINDCFEIDNLNSIDKRLQDDIDKVGYRSLHLICKLGSTRKLAYEYKSHVKRPFEIQIRTVLQHAWAEIEHKENYKVSGGNILPPALQRRLNILSGTLELIDREISKISSDARDYKVQLETDSSSFKLDQISMTSLESVVRKAAKSHGVDIRATRVMEQSSESKFLKELYEFGIITIGDLENIINGCPFDIFKEFKSGTTVIGLSRSLMMYTDARKYFS